MSIKNKFLRSLRFRILVLVLGSGIIPSILVSIGMQSGFEERSVSLKIKEVQVQTKILANQISSYDYLNDTSIEVINGELAQLSNLYNGRIMVIDKSFRIVKDTYSLEKDKTIISEEVVKSFQGEDSSYYDKKNGFIEVTVPIIDSLKDDRIGVMVVCVSTANILDSIEAMKEKSLIVQIAVYIVIWVVAVFFSTKLVKPFGRISSAIEGLSDGYLDENISVADYTETELISQAFNKMLGRIKVLDDSRQEFVSNVSHELKTPITSMKVLADSLLMQEDVPVELYKEFMTDIAEEIDRESKIINDLLSLVRMDKSSANLNINLVNINEMLELILKRLRPIAANRNIELVFESFRPVTAEVDEVKLTLAFSNLVENAIKYNKDDGWVHVSLNSDHKYFFVEVADSGIGIPEESLEHIFERFYRVDKSHSTEISGTGLGLAITRSAILMHRGAVKVYSKENEGTTFTVRVPLNYIT
ncbi:sensor histidine kinase [Anaerosacchariphilus polymeriproducens]|uniref:histidine kinase n=1 Tax=Anaerosacchariphilus polymeriproducens TaxID=1812858 RepID=A0A371AX08_9FIRM|nr:sensor histidine kinase [Anaerosacchariphilus polymeriproducens]